MTLNTNKAKTVTEAVLTRLTVRDFLDTPVDKETLRQIFETARRAPSGGNLQPWNVHVLTGEKLDNFRHEVIGKLMKGEIEQETFAPYPSPLWEPMRSWRYKLGEDMYKLLGIPKDDKPARLRQVGKNFTFFSAPVGILITGDKRLEVPQYYDIGIYLQTLMLLAREQGLHTAPQGAWRSFPDTIKAHVGHPDEQHILVGMSMGYANPDAPVNQLVSDRAPLDELVHFHD
ncbi:MAG TPA: nitroreductase [Hellea balneolensis]|uniref:Nitroreductase n=1 Tax=Hellea balneolensis TaxID=287478 RepID=A0A7C5M1A2_9PROT|nr:nitroreductase [Hellea balneolensis]